MNKLEALIILRDKVKAGDDWCGDMPWPEGLSVTHTIQAYKGSLDAAKALHEAVLPEWDWRLRSSGCAWVWRTAMDLQESREQETPARAWLLAILEALIAQEGG